MIKAQGNITHLELGPRSRPTCGWRRCCICSGMHGQSVLSFLNKQCGTSRGYDNLMPTCTTRNGAVYCGRRLRHTYSPHSGDSNSCTTSTQTGSHYGFQDCPRKTNSLPSLRNTIELKHMIIFRPWKSRSFPYSCSRFHYRLSCYQHTRFRSRAGSLHRQTGRMQ